MNNKIKVNPNAIDNTNAKYNYLIHVSEEAKATVGNYIINTYLYSNPEGESHFKFSDNRPIEKIEKILTKVDPINPFVLYLIDKQALKI